MRLVAKCKTLYQLYQEAASAWPDKTITFCGTEHSLTYAALVDRASRIASGLQKRGIERGELVGIIQGNEPDFLLSFAAISLAGAVPTPLPLPASAGGIAAFLYRIRSIVDDAKIRHMMVSSFLTDHIRRLGGQAQGLLEGVTLLSCDDLHEEGGTLQSANATSEAMALVQYTSGSTSSPKGVALRHRNVLASVDAIGLGIQLQETDINGQWLPLFHDMGLIGTLTGIAHGVDHYFWQPGAFIRRPAKWLREFAEVGASIYAGPNFSYQYLIENVSPELMAELDLSRWRVAFNGAESIDPLLMGEFLERFAGAGFRASTMFPVYGLAEATLAVTFPVLGSEPFTLWVDRNALSDDCVVKPVNPKQADGTGKNRGVVSVGVPIKGQEVRIVDPEGDGDLQSNSDGDGNDARVLPSGRVGEIEIRGTAIMDGYYGTEAAARSQDGLQADGESGDGRAVPQAKWLPTGDLGFFWEDRLFITGRKKQLLIVRGQNYYPEDIEWEARTIEGVYRGRSVAVVGIDEHGAETVSIIAETELKEQDALEALSDAVITRIRATLGIALGAVVFVRKRSIRRTTNGKYQRVLMGRLLREGELARDILYSSVPSTSDL